MSVSYRDLRTFARQVYLRGVLHTVTGLHVGAGRSDGLLSSDLPVVLDTLSRPVIPGSSLKGALRAYAETVLRSLEVLLPPQAPSLACDPLAAPCIPQPDVAQIKEQDSADESLWRRTCRACRLFGAPWLASRVLIKDLPVVESGWFGQVERRDGVSIDRDKRTAQARKLYAYEVVPECTPFRFELVANDVDDAELGLLLLTLEGIDRGLILLGGARSRGLGGVTLEVDWDHVEQVTPANALSVFGARVLGEAVPVVAWTKDQRDAWIVTFFQSLGLSETEIVRWQTARSAQEVSNAES